MSIRCFRFRWTVWPSECRPFRARASTCDSGTPPAIRMSSAVARRSASAVRRPAARYFCCSHDLGTDKEKNQNHTSFQVSAKVRTRPNPFFKPYPLAVSNRLGLQYFVSFPNLTPPTARTFVGRHTRSRFQFFLFFVRLNQYLHVQRRSSSNTVCCYFFFIL